MLYGIKCQCCSRQRHAIYQLWQLLGLASTGNSTSLHVHYRCHVVCLVYMKMITHICHMPHMPCTFFVFCAFYLFETLRGAGKLAEAGAWQRPQLLGWLSSTAQLYDKTACDNLQSVRQLPSQHGSQKWILLFICSADCSMVIPWAAIVLCGRTSLSAQYRATQHMLHKLKDACEQCVVRNMGFMYTRQLHGSHSQWQLAQKLKVCIHGLCMQLTLCRSNRSFPPESVCMSSSSASSSA